MMLVVTQQDIARMSPELREELMRIMFGPERSTDMEFDADIPPDL